jgi:hypothetical protein
MRHHIIPIAAKYLPFCNEDRFGINYSINVTHTKELLFQTYQLEMHFKIIGKLSTITPV